MRIYLKFCFIVLYSVRSDFYAINSQILESWHQRRFMAAATANELSPGQVFIVLKMATTQLIHPLLNFQIQLYMASLDIHISPYTKVFLYALPLCLTLCPTENA